MKGIQKATRLLLVLLALSMMLSTFAACSVEDDGSGEESGDTIKTNENNGPVYVDDNIPDGLNFGDDFLVLSSNNQKSHYWAAEDDVTPVGQALYKRNETVESRLGIAIQWDHQPCSSSSAKEKDAFVQKAETDISAGTSYDCVVSYNLLPYRLAAKGLAVNLKDTTYIDLDMPYWPDEFLDNMLYKDQIYALVDNASVGTVTNLSCIFFNNDLIEAKGLENPYDLVANNEWTIPKLKELIKDTYDDVDGDGEDADKDIYGLCTSTTPRLTCWYYGAGLRFSNFDAEGTLTLNTDVESTTNKLEAIVDLFSTRDSLTVDTSQYVMFKEERVYFYLSIISMCTSMVNAGLEINYGVAPIPKLTSAQPRYYTHVPNTHESWYLLKGVKDEDCSSAFIECMASEAYRQVNEVFFENCVKLRYAPDERLADMYDLIRESITFDFVYVYGDVIGWQINNGIHNCIKNPKKYQWATVWGEIKEPMATKFQTILDVYEKNQ